MPVACEVANSAIFVNEGPEDDLGSWFGAAAEELASVGSEGLRTLDQRSVTIPVNWKRVMGRLLAAPPVPPRPGVDALATTAADVELLDGGHLRIVAPFDAVSARALGLSGPPRVGQPQRRRPPLGAGPRPDSSLHDEHLRVLPQPVRHLYAQRRSQLRRLAAR